MLETGKKKNRLLKRKNLYTTFLRQLNLVDAKLESLEVSTMGLILASCHFKEVLSYFKDPQVW